MAIAPAAATVTTAIATRVFVGVGEIFGGLVSI
jgi:hypothetical protein